MQKLRVIKRAVLAQTGAGDAVAVSEEKRAPTLSIASGDPIVMLRERLVSETRKSKRALANQDALIWGIN